MTAGTETNSPAPEPRASTSGTYIYYYRLRSLKEEVEPPVGAGGYGAFQHKSVLRKTSFERPVSYESRGYQPVISAIQHQVIHAE